jgi:predicted MFS family arabinose efflux permease
MIAIGGSGFLVPMVSTVTRWFVKKRGMMTSIVISSLGTCEIIMPPLARWLIATYGWRDSYIILGITLVVIIATGAQFIKRDPSQMGMLPYGSDEAKEEHTRMQVTGLDLQQALRTKEIWILAAVMLCYFFSQSFVATHIVILATGLGISRTSAANIMVLIGGMYIVSLNIAGNIVNKIGKRWEIAAGFLLQAIALFSFFLSKDTWMLYLSAIILGLGRGTAMAPMPLLIADIYGLKSFGVIQGIIFFGATAGHIIGPVLTGYIFDTTGSYSIALLSCLGVAILAIVLISLVRTSLPKSGTLQPGN